MLELIHSLGHWTWWILGILLLVAELLLPGIYMLWFGLAALAVGALAFAVDGIGWQVQIVAFGVLSIGAVVVSRRLARSRPGEGDAPFLNERSAALVGRSFYLADPIVGGAGRIVVDDTLWRVHGPDLPAGTRVRVVRAEGTHIAVERDG
ncbi:hypothetical protein EDC22_101123 [Tepidamorphus gemmatus]|uniref:NfeD-like C-terminal domain-containing protein n=1 Tax=Tepidamorphus gemmatus TaxID=747076 RepID=A0A4R3MI05_9HYPH|nr:NfeD family protein [Tepidamorphus gemmatus]TCT13262.1 hypothetical protein EDC22_101123 [Tepidamorphus gemmatus]